LTLLVFRSWKSNGTSTLFSDHVENKLYVLIIFLLALLLGIICDLQMSLVFRINIFMFISSKTEPQKMILPIFVFSVSRHKEN
jgi:hypothetical protein